MTRSHPLFRIAGNASRMVRRRQYIWFREAVGGVAGKVVLDHGSTPDTKSPDSNCFIRWLLDDGAFVFSTSIEDISHLPALFPGLQLIPWPPREHFGRKADVVVASSVVQHVGNRDAQIAYIEDVLSLAPLALVTTPNRRHWLEFHTKLPLLHWLPKARHRAILDRLGLKFWARESNLNLLMREEFQGLLDEAARRANRQVGYRWFRPRFLGQISHLVVLVSG